MKRRAIYGLVGLALIVGCGGDDGGGSDERTDAKTDARNPDLQFAVETQIKQETESGVGLGPDRASHLLPGETTAKCKPVSDGKLACVVKGETPEGAFRWEWEATVSDSGRFVAMPTLRDNPGGILD